MRQLLTFLTTCVLLILMPAISNAQPVGSIASVTTRLSANGQSTSVGFKLSANDAIKTNRTGRGQILFNDQTTLTVAPNSDIVLDKFVFDPNKGTGEIGLNLTKGALRFVGGKITKQTTATVETPSGTIGFRGGIVLITHGPDGVRAIFLAGEQMCVTVGGSKTCTSRRGGILTQDGYQGEVSEAELAQLISLIDGPLLANTNQGDTTLGGLSELFSPFDDDISTIGEGRTIVIIEEDLDGVLRDPPVRGQPSGNRNCKPPYTSC